MKKNVIICTIFLLVILNGCVNTDSIPQNMAKIDGIEYYYDKMYPRTIDYLKNRSDYTKEYNSGKKWVFYHAGDCAYNKNEQSTLNELSKLSKYKENYVFTPETRELDDYVFNTQSDEVAFTIFIQANCNGFCIVNPKTGYFFTPLGDSDLVAKNAQYFLDKLINW